jgi:hypothetical protein
VGVGLDRDVPDHSTLSKNWHGLFRQAGVFREVFEEIVRRCLAAGFVVSKTPFLAKRRVTPRFTAGDIEGGMIAPESTLLRRPKVLAEIGLQLLVGGASGIVPQIVP